MSEKSDPIPGEAIESQPDPPASTAAEAYPVGPGRPPRDTRWKKGGPSPNPRGRPRKDQSVVPDVRKAFEQALNKKITVSLGGRQVLMTRIDAGFEQLLNQFAKGDPRARRDVMEYAGKLGIDFLAEHRQAIEEALAPDHQAILESYVARRSGAGNVAPAEPALAPPELLDDDPADAEARVASPPTAVTGPAPQPGPEPSRTEKPAVPGLNQGSIGRGRPPPGGFSLTTRKPT